MLLVCVSACVCSLPVYASREANKVRAREGRKSQRDKASERAMFVVPGMKSVLGFGLLRNKLTTSRIYAAEMPRRKEAREG